MSTPDLNVRDIANLARLNLSDEEIATFQPQLSHVLEYIEQLKNVDVTGVEPTAHANPVFDITRPDKSREGFSAETALSNAPRELNGLFSVTKVIK